MVKFLWVRVFTCKIRGLHQVIAPNFICPGLLLSASQDLYERSREDLRRIKIREELAIGFSDHKDRK